MRAALTAALPHLPGAGVKKLEWKTERADKVNGVDTECIGFHEFGYYALTGKSSGCFVSTFDNMGRVRHVDPRGFGSIEAAKAAAQADYSARILSALEPSAARMQALEDKVRLDAATAALISLSEAGIPTDVQELLIVGDPSRGIAPESLSKAIATVLRALGTSCEQLNKAVSNVPDQQENEPGAHGERERALEGERHIKLLAEALGKCLVAAGIVRPDAALTGPELLMFAEDLERALSSPDHADAGKLVEGDGWLPIESAPKDGTWFLAYRPEPDGGTWDRLCIVCWSAEEDDFVWPDDTFDVYRDDLSDMDDRGFLKFDTYSSCGSFTHWRPLPSAPSQEVAGS